MSHPSTNYLKYLTIKGLAEGEILDVDGVEESELSKTHDGPSDALKELQLFYDELQYVMTELGLPGYSFVEFRRMHRHLKIPKYVQFHNPRHKKTSEFMDRMGVREIWNPGPGEREVFVILKNHLVQDTIKILLMGRVSPLDIASRVSRKFDINLPVPAVQLYYRYFWNVQKASATEWNDHLRGNYLRSHLMASLHGSPGQALYRAGFNPRIDGAVSLKDLQRTLHYRLEATRMMPDNTDTASILSRLSNQLLTVHQVLYGEGAGLEDTLRKFREFRMELKKVEATPIHELAPHGNYSNSGAKEKEDGRRKRALPPGPGLGQGGE